VRNIRLHGNGFIQVDIDPDTRLHVWWPKALPKAQHSPTPIHNHTYSFSSHVVKGHLTNLEYRLFPGDDYRVLRAVTRDGQDTRLDEGGMTTSAGVKTYRTYGPGDTYEWAAGAFHESRPATEIVITVMRKTAVGAAIGPHVLCPKHVEPDNVFNRYTYAPDLLENLVLKALTTLPRPVIFSPSTTVLA
jgi:hypothetical protein